MVKYLNIGYKISYFVKKIYHFVEINKISHIVYQISYLVYQVSILIY